MGSIVGADMAAGAIADSIAVHGETVVVYELNGAAPREITAIVEVHNARVEHTSGAGRQRDRVEQVRIIATTSTATGLGNPGPGQSVRLESDDPTDRWAWTDTERRYASGAAVVAIYRKITRNTAGTRPTR